jgi:TPR repeat protein
MALAKLGSMYKKGKGVFTDYVNAYMWYFIAEHKGNRQAASASKAK